MSWVAGDNRPPSRASSGLRRARSVIAFVLVATGFLLGAVMVLPALLGFERYVVTGDSMTGTYDRGSVVMADTVPVSELRVGDVITYVPPPGQGPGGRVTHRIVSIQPGEGGSIFQTKGDANATVDPWLFQLPGPDQARVVFSVPYVGYAIGALGIREVRMLVIGLPALLIALVLLSRLWRDAGEEARRRAEASGPGRAV
jgi:signal peptidase